MSIDDLAPRATSERPSEHPAGRHSALFVTDEFPVPNHGTVDGSLRVKSPRARAAFLAEATRLLAESLDYELILQRVAEAAVPQLADWCVVDVIHGPGAAAWPPAVRRVAVAGRDPGQVAWARKLGKLVERDWTAPNGLPKVLRTGESAFFPEITPDFIEAASLSEPEKVAFRQIGLGSAICVPLVARGRTFGAISFAMAESGRRYVEADLELAEDLGRRAAVAIDNARLYAAERAARVAAERAALHLERLQAVTAALSHARTPHEVGRVVVDHGIEALGARSASLAVVDPATQTLELICASGYSSGATAKYRRIPLDAPFPLTDVVRDRQPLVLASAEERDARFPHLAQLRRENGAGAMAALPLLVDGRAIGALGFNFPESRPIDGEDRAVLTAIAHQGAQALDRARLYEAELRAREEMAGVQRRQAAVLDAVADGFATVDRDWRCTYVNRAAAEMFARSAGTLVGRVLWDLYPEAAGSEFARTLSRAMHERMTVYGEAFSRPLGGWFEYHAYPTDDDGISVFFRDITERRTHDERVRFLGEASKVLSSSIDYETTLANIARLAVPSLASSCVIDLLSDSGELERVATMFESPELRARVAEMRRRNPLRATTSHPVRDVLDTGESQFFPNITASVLPRLVDETPDALVLVQALNPTSCIFVALKARGRTFGVMSLSTTGARRRFDDRDRVLIEELAQRVAMAVDNARLHAAERRARAQAEAANQAKSDFLAIMSHELRTPLTAVVGYTELLSDEVVGPVNDTQREHLGRVRASSEHLLMLIEDILSYARIEAGREQVHVEEFALAALLEQASVIVRPLAEKKGLAFSVVGTSSSAVIRSDPQKVRQILINLLANAMKFTERGSVRLAASAAGDHVRFEVTDTGPGIEPENVERVFEAFWQVDQRMTRRLGGTGLGLSVARQLARLLGGDVRVTSTVGAGSTFSVDLPLMVPAAR